MRLALISEEYDKDFADGGLFYVREALCRMFPQAEMRALKRRRPPRGLWQAWRQGVAVENIDIRGFDLVVSLSHGFSHGVIPQLTTRHIGYLFSHPPLWTAPGLAGHWYRLWARQAAARVDEWVVNSRWLAAALKKHERREGRVIHPPLGMMRPLGVEELSEKRQPCVAITAEQGKTAAVAAVLKACNEMQLQGVILNPRRQAREVISRALFLVVGDAHAFSPVALEALALGKPVLAYRSGGLAEIIDEGRTGLFFEDIHPGVIADGIRRMRERLGRFEPTALRARAAEFSKERFTQEFSALLETLHFTL